MTEVDICNLALSHLGDVANVESIDPPESSAQAEHCARYYPIARDELLEMHDWAFATRRATLALLASSPSTAWDYAYAAPVDMLTAIAVQPAGADDDVSAGARPASQFFSGPDMTGAGMPTPREFVTETAPDGTPVILTDTAQAVLRYKARVLDTAQFSPTFITALAASLASMLAGPIIKGETGATMARTWLAIAFGRDGKSGLFGRAAGADASGKLSTDFRRNHRPDWLSCR